MKSLKDFLIESKSNDETPESKSFTFNFADMENADDIIKSLEENDNVSIDDKKVSVTVSKDANIDTVQDILQQSIQTLRKSSKSINDEQYAQKTAALERTLGEMNDFIDELNAEPEENEEDNKEENKDSDEEDDK